MGWLTLHKYLKLSVFVAAGVVIAAGAVAECPECDEPGFPEAVEFLALHGYPADQYAVLLVWQESARATGEMISGYRVRPDDGGELFDLYADGDDNLLDQAQLDALGIKPKNWNLEPIERKTEIPPFQWKSAPARPVPVGPKEKLAPAPVLGLGPLSEAELNPAPESGIEKPRNRIGVVRPMPGRVSVRQRSASAGAWRNLPDGGKMWTLTVQSPGARAMRLHFSGVQLPGSVTVTVYNTAEPVEAYGPFSASDFGDGAFWSPSCFADSCTIECVLPPGASEDAFEDAFEDGLQFEIDKVVHTYEDFGDIAWTKQAASCNLDVTCYPEWYPVSRGVAAFSFVYDVYQLYCTGTLVVDSKPDTSVPYFLTANHCLDDTGEPAGSMEFFWLYQTSECNGTPPDLSSVPRTAGGADLLAREAVSDFALVRLHNNPPEGIPYIGWTTDHVEVGAAMAAVHHPAQSYKHVSFGHITDSGSPTAGGIPPSGRTYEFFLESLWDRTARNPEWPDGGTTEAGSSGCPLFLRDSQLIVGQLWGGYASCSESDEPDYFGRFEKTFPLVDQWLGEGEEGEGEGEEGEGEGEEGEGEGEEPPPGCFSGGTARTPLASAVLAAAITFFLRSIGESI